MGKYGVLLALTLGACITYPKAPEPPPTLTLNDAKAALSTVHAEAYAGYLRCAPGCQWAFDYFLAHFAKANRLLDAWGVEVGQSGLFRCLMRHMGTALEPLCTPDSNSRRIAAKMAEDAPDRCSP